MAGMVTPRRLWIRTLFLLGIFCDLLLADPRLDLTTPDGRNFIQPGSNVQLHCKVYNLLEGAFAQGTVISFRKDEHTKLGNYTPTSANTESNHFTIRGFQRTNFYEVILSIIGISQEDNGQYQCGTVTSEEWTIGSTSVKLELMKIAPPEYPKCSFKTRKGKLKFTCEAKDVVPKPTMKWKRGNVLESEDMQQVYETWKVEIEKDMNDTDEPFVCWYSYFDSTNHADNRSCWIGKPKLLVIPTGGSQSYTIGDDVNVTFTAFSHPQMTKQMDCTWNYQEAADSFRAIKDGNTNVVITLSDVQIAMSHTVVSCTGVNAMGSTTASFTLLVEDVVENNLTASLTTDKVYLSVGQSTTFNCEIGFIPPVQQVNYDWSFQDMPVKVNHEFWKGRFNGTENNNQLVLNSASLDDDGKVISCMVHYGGKTLMSSSTEIAICSNPREMCKSVQQDSCQPHISPLVEGVICVVVFVCVVVFLTLLYCRCSRLRKPPSKVNIGEYIGDAMRTSSFASSASESRDSETSGSQLVHVRQDDRSPILKRSISLPSSRGLPSIPVSPTLPPVHEYEKTPSRGATYSFIKSETEPKEASQQAYMDMAAGKKLIKQPAAGITCFEKIPPPLVVSMDTVGDTQCPSSATPACAGATAAEASAEEWYLEAKRSPDSAVQYHDLEDLYRETAKSNVYSPSR